MNQPLDNVTQIDRPPREFLERAGRVFAVFGDNTQDSGNVSYGVEADGRRFFVKTAGDPADARWFLSHAQRVALLRNAVELAASCSHPALVRLHRVIESPHGPMLIYDWAEGRLLQGGGKVLADPQSAHRQFVELPAEQILAALDDLYSLHAQLAAAGWVAVDLYDGCLIYDFDRHILHVADLDHYHRGPLTNEMGRMFGSTRFMAPEEFQLGATIDQRTTIFTLGRFAAVFLGGGSLDAGAFRGSPAIREVICRACQGEPPRRFGSVADLHSSWKAART